ncbi:DUF986 family protein, partial [Alkalihalophilus pseudofirmus]
IPKVHFKEKGFYNGIIYIPYESINHMNLSEDGILVIESDNKRRQLLQVATMEDLERIYKVFTTY